MLKNKRIVANTTKLDRKLWFKVIQTISSLSKYFQEYQDVKEPHYECHSICRALSIHIPELKAVDGLFIGYIPTDKDGEITIEFQRMRHSWLVTPDGAVIDPYPVGFLTLQAILVVTKGSDSSYGGNFYFKNTIVTQEIWNRDMWRRSAVMARFMSLASKTF